MIKSFIILEPCHLLVAYIIRINFVKACSISLDLEVMKTKISLSKTDHKFQLLIKIQIVKSKDCSPLQDTVVLFILAINVIMPTNAGMVYINEQKDVHAHLR